MSYPRWKYHNKEKSRIVNNEEEERELGHGWVDSPAHLKHEAPIKVEGEHKFPNHINEFKDPDSEIHRNPSETVTHPEVKLHVHKTEDPNDNLDLVVAKKKTKAAQPKNKSH
jgi:hypothetical protein